MSEQLKSMLDATDPFEWEEHECATCGESGACRSNGIVWTCRECEMPGEPIAPGGGCMVKCPECVRAGAFFVEAGAPILFCAQCALGDGRRVRLVVAGEVAT